MNILSIQTQTKLTILETIGMNELFDIIKVLIMKSYI